jgi:hypothetical protein
MANGHTRSYGLVYGTHVEKEQYCIPDRLNYCVIFKVYTQFTNVDVGRVTQLGGPRVVQSYFSLLKPSGNFTYHQV